MKINEGFRLGTLVAVVALGLATSACVKRDHAEVNRDYDIPSDLKDCKFYRLTSDIRSDLTVVRCPSSNTNVFHREGKRNEFTVSLEPQSTVIPTVPETVMIEGKIYKLEK